MKTNRDVIEAFRQGKTAHNHSLTSTGDKLFSYATVIFQRNSRGQIIANTAKFSQTTSCHQSCYRRWGVDIEVNVPRRGVNDLLPYVTIENR